MTQGYYLSGPPSVFRGLMRGLLAAVVVVSGVFLFIASAAVAMFVLSGIVIIGLLAFAFFWVRAKLFGKPFGPQVHFERTRAEMEAQFRAYSQRGPRTAPDGSGPVLDARPTPDGWTVDD